MLHSLISSKIAHGLIFCSSGICERRISRGRLVTTPFPLGKKSKPTIDSKTEDFPEDWVPKTAIRGRLIYC